MAYISAYLKEIVFATSTLVQTSYIRDLNTLTKHYTNTQTEIFCNLPIKMWILLYFCVLIKQINNTNSSHLIANVNILVAKWQKYT